MAVKKLFIDIETIPPGRIEDFEITKAPPKNIKDPAKIEAWYKDNFEKDFRKQALDPNLAHILCIGAAFEDDEVSVFHSDEENVKEILTNLYEFIQINTVEELEDDKELFYDINWIGHNVRKFDLEVIWVSAIKNNIFDLAKLISRHAYSKNVIDTMEIWAGPNRQNYTSLDTILRTLGLGQKMEGMDGSQVYDEYLAGNLYSKILPYVSSDVEDVRKIYNHISQGLDF